MTVDAPRGAGHSYENAERPTIGIVMAQVFAQRVQRVSCNYLHSVIGAGGIPMVFPVTEDTAIYERLLPLVDGLLFTGGHDIEPERYGAEEGLAQDPTPQRDSAEFHVLEYACEHDLPVAGICRGIQLLNVFFGGTLYEDVNQQFYSAGRAVRTNGQQPIRHMQPVYAGGLKVHDVSLAPDSTLARVFAPCYADAENPVMPVNSLHHQAVRELGRGVRATAFSEDGLIEGIEVEGHAHMVGVQWHPEYFGEPGGDMSCYFEALVDAAATWRAGNRGC